VRLVPLIHGCHQERSRRAGTENLPAIVGLGVAAERSRARLPEAEQHGARLGAALLAGLLGAVPGTRLNGDPERRVPGIVNVCFPGLDGGDPSGARSRQQTPAGGCRRTRLGGPEAVAMGLSAEDAHASVRFSLGESNEAADVSRILQALPPMLERLRALAEMPVRDVSRSA
jgi:cysteine desulfurase